MSLGQFIQVVATRTPSLPRAIYSRRAEEARSATAPLGGRAGDRATLLVPKNRCCNIDICTRHRLCNNGLRASEGHLLDRWRQPHIPRRRLSSPKEVCFRHPRRSHRCRSATPTQRLVICALTLSTRPSQGSKVQSSARSSLPDLRHAALICTRFPRPPRPPC